jgi:hypothetical protein
LHYALFISTVVAYALSLALYLIFLNTGKALTGRLGTLLLGAGLVMHYFVLLERSEGTHTVPYHDLYGAMSLFGWLLALTYLGLEPTSRPPIDSRLRMRTGQPLLFTWLSTFWRTRRLPSPVC